ncbi:unnamed protein product [Alopecurus aequalis]
MTRRCRPSSPPVPPLEDDNLLEEILLRLPPQPSSLPRASAVCTRWCHLLSDARFLRRFGKHHRKPPMLGCFSGDGCRNTVFNPTLDVPRPPRSYEHWDLVGCRHGLAVILNWLRKEVILWHPSPATSAAYHTRRGLKARRALPEARHWISVHALPSVSESAAWGDMITTPTTSSIYNGIPSVMAGNALCWLLRDGGILEFDLETESLGVIEKPADAHVDGDTFWDWQVIRTEDGGLGLAVLSKSELCIQLCQRKCNCDGVVGWEQHTKILLNELFPLTVLENLARRPKVRLVGYDEDANVIVLTTYNGDFTLQLEQAQLKQFTHRKCHSYNYFYPYSSFYTTGNTTPYTTCF